MIRSFLTAKAYWLLFLGILGGGFVLRIWGVSTETPVCYDEMRPNIELLGSNLVQFFLHSLGDSMARPGFVFLKTLGLVLGKLFSPSSAPGSPAMPLGFQIALDLASLVILMHLIHKWLVVRAEAKWPAALWAGLFWAASPMLVRYTHRMLPPTYALFSILCFYWIFFWACSKNVSEKPLIPALFRPRSRPRPRFLKRIDYDYADDDEDDSAHQNDRTSLKSNMGAFFLVGLVAAACFLIYPGLYYLLLMTPLLLLLPRVRSAISLRALFYLGAGGILLPVVLQAFMMAVKVFTDNPNYFTYLGQIRHVGTHILHGEPRENLVFPFQLLWAANEYQLIPLLGLILAALIFRIRRALPWAGMLVGIYAIWIINGPLLNREVIYSRTVVLVYPLVVIAASLTLVALAPNWTKRAWLIGVSAVILFGLSGSVLMTTPVYRNHASRVKTDLSHLIRMSPEEFDLVTDWNDYGTYASEHWTRLQDTVAYRRQHSGRRPLFVAYNLRAWSAPCYPILQTPVKPLLRYPSPIREPYFQFEGFYSAERKLLRQQPEKYDVKVYRAEDLLAHPPHWIKGNLPSWMDHWK